MIEVPPHMLTMLDYDVDTSVITGNGIPDPSPLSSPAPSSKMS